MIISKEVNLQWNKNTKKYYIDKGYLFTFYGDNFIVNVLDLPDQAMVEVEIICDFCTKPSVKLYKSIRNKNISCCNTECNKLLVVSNSKKVEYNCVNCGEEITLFPSQVNKNESGNVFCSNKCVGEFNFKTYEDRRIEKLCLICSKLFTTIKSKDDSHITCSRECQVKWQSKYLIGEEANRYFLTDEMKNKTCTNCNTHFQVENSRRINQDNVFCSNECRQSWYSDVWSQTEEWKEESSIRAVKMLEDGTFNSTDTACQKVVNSILEDLNINYVNEYNCKYFSIDNFLSESNLMIEVMGTFWHSDPRYYKQIHYQRQVDRIINDKRKKTYIKNKYAINILYLWEFDVMNNENLCKEIILDYIRNNGILDNYHSFNYLMIDDELAMNQEIIQPYTEYDIGFLNENIFKIKKTI